MRTLGPRRLLVDGGILALLFVAVVVVSSAIDPMLWLDDYPPDIQAAVDEGADAPLGLRIFFAILLGVVLLGGIFVATWRAAKEAGEGFTFRRAFLHVFCLFWIVNAADVVVLDWGIGIFLQPDFMILPGTEGLPGYEDYAFHLRQSFLHPTPWVASALLSVLIAGTVSLARRFN